MGLLKRTALALLTGFAAVSFAQQPGDSGTCLEALVSSGCQLRWELLASSATAKSANISGATSAGLLAKLDYQWLAPKAPQKTPRDGFTAHLIFESGYTQAMIATKLAAVQPAGSTTAAAVTPLEQPAFEISAASTIGWTIGRNGQGGAFAEFGFGARGAFDDLLAANQIVQSGGATYLDLSLNNPQSLAGRYEATVHFHVSSWNHNQPASSSGVYSNVSNLLVIEAGYQDNSGLQQLAAGNPLINTRVRFVGRAFLSPEIPNSAHTKLRLGMEFSGGIGGGPKTVQIFAGTNLNPAKIFGAGSN